MAVVWTPQMEHITTCTHDSGDRYINSVWVGNNIKVVEVLIKAVAMLMNVNNKNMYFP